MNVARVFADTRRPSTPGATRYRVYLAGDGRYFRVYEDAAGLYITVKGSRMDLTREEVQAP